jgi:hypothetical protein
LLGLPLSLDTTPVFAAFLALVWVTWERITKSKHPPVLLSSELGLLTLTQKAMILAAALLLVVFASMALSATLGRGVLSALVALPQPWPPGVAWLVLLALVLLCAAVLEPFGFIFVMVLVLGPWVQTLGLQDEHWLWVVWLGAGLAARRCLGYCHLHNLPG